MKLVIERDKWLRGDQVALGGSYLLRKSDGKMCCLGFYCKAKGVAEKDIRGISTPSGLYQLRDESLPELLELPDDIVDDEHRAKNNDICDELMDVNDRKMDEKEREKDIIRLFSKINVDVEFK